MDLTPLSIKDQLNIFKRISVFHEFEWLGQTVDDLLQN